jgi:hypothetical protein
MPTNPALWDPTLDPNDPYYGNSNGTQSDQLMPEQGRNGWTQTPMAAADGTQTLGLGSTTPTRNWAPTAAKLGQQVTTPPPTTQQVYNSWADYFQNQGLGSLATNVDPYQSALNTGLQQDAASRNQILGSYGQALGSATSSNAGLLAGMDQSRQNLDASGNQLLGNYWGQLGQANNLATGSLAQLQGLSGQMRTLTAGGYGADVTSDPAYVGMQMGAYNNFGNWASGANNISSDAGLVGQQQGVANQFGGWASGANDISSDPGLVGMQQGVFGAYGDWASGANDVFSDQALVGQQQNVLDSYGDWSSGQYDLSSDAALATADADSLAAQKDALSQFKERSDPKLTDAERFLYLQNRLQQEQTMRGVRDANMRELQRQGMSGSTMALSNLNASSQEAANMRQLGDLGANAAAIKRADANLGNYANLSSTIADQSFGRDFATRSAADRMAVQNNMQRFSGLQGEGQMATAMRSADDNLRVNNQQARFQGLQGQGVQANTMRSQDDAIRGQNQGMRMQGLQGQGSMVNSMRSSDDAMRTGNANRMLTAAGMQGDMATSMRTADDALRTFNKEQGMIQQRFQDSFAADQQQQAWNRGNDLTNAGLRTSEGLARNATTGWEAGNTTLNNQWDRYATQTQAGMTANRDYMTGVGDASRLGMGAIDSNRAGLAQSAQFALGSEGVRQGIMSNANNVRMQGVSEQNEDRRAQAALDAGTAEANRAAKAAKTKQALNVAGNAFMPFLFKGV